VEANSHAYILLFTLFIYIILSIPLETQYSKVDESWICCEDSSTLVYCVSGDEESKDEEFSFSSP